MVQIRISNPVTEDAVVTVTRPGEKACTVRGASTIKKLNTRILEAVRAHVCASLGLNGSGGNWFLALINPTINVSV